MQVAELIEDLSKPGSWEDPSALWQYVLQLGILSVEPTLKRAVHRLMRQS
jgi:hypothetical protein